jgi:hypothetical protein
MDQDRTHRRRVNGRRLRAGGELQALVDRARRTARLADTGTERGGDLSVERRQVFEALRVGRRAEQQQGNGQEASETRHGMALQSI